MTPQERRNLKRRQQRAIAAAQRATSASVKLLNEIRADTVPGLCPFCDAPIPPSKARPWKRCAADECRREYHRIHRVELYREQRRRQAK